MENLPDDIVVHIFSRLPFRDAVRCRILNKKLNTLVQQFEQENIVQSYTKVCNHVYFSPYLLYNFYRLRLDPPYPTRYHEDRTCKNFQGWFPLVSSCGGLLLLRLFPRIYCVLNPLTGEYQLVPTDQRYNGSGIGLAVHHSYRFRLVAIQTQAGRVEGESLFKFRIFTASLSMWEDAHEEYLPYDWRCEHSPVYSHGSLHWLVQFNTIISFDLEKRRLRTFQGPPCRPNWFGVVQGSLVYVNVGNYEIVIYVYDHVSSEWHADHQIGTLEPQNTATCNVDVKFFNGERLVILDKRNCNEEDYDGEIYMCDIFKKLWKKIGTMTIYIMDERNKLVDQFIPFIPTTTKLYSGCDLYGNDKESLHRFLEALVSLFKAESS